MTDDEKITKLRTLTESLCSRVDHKCVYGTEVSARISILRVELELCALDALTRDHRLTAVETAHEIVSDDDDVVARRVGVVTSHDEERGILTVEAGLQPMEENEYKVENLG